MQIKDTSQSKVSTQAEKNQFRRLIGDYPAAAVIDATVEGYLDDAVQELTADFVDTAGASAPVTDFDVLLKQYHPEVIVWAALNWWWNKASALADRHSQSVGDSDQKLSEKWDRAMAMIKELEARYQLIQALGTDISIGDFSRWSKKTMSRLGGRSEEQIIDELT